MLVLTILKIIGILLLVLLGLLFSAALLVLVVPLRYRIWMEYRESLKAKDFRVLAAENGGTEGGI